METVFKKFEMKDVTLAKRGAQRVIGMMVSSTMEKASEDCSALWRDGFGPRMPEVRCLPIDESYGISLITGEGDGGFSFDYWAALPVDETAPIPHGMRELRMPESLYAVCPVQALSLLTAAYTFIYEQWLPQSGYELNMRAPSFELYPEEYMKTGAFMLYMPVKKI